MGEYSDRLQNLKKQWQQHGVCEIPQTNIILMGIFEQMELQNQLLQILVNVGGSDYGAH